jgi:hypothetical protein
MDYVVICLDAGLRQKRNKIQIRRVVNPFTTVYKRLNTDKGLVTSRFFVICFMDINR